MPRSWGKWQNIDQLSEGGQAHTFLVKPNDGEGVFVLKRLKNSNRLGRFRQEIDAGMTLDHSNVLKVIDSSGLDEEGVHWFVSEYCEKGTIAELNVLQLSPNERLCIFVGICRGVAHAHEQKIVHRDLKPSNIFLKNGLFPVVGDFGLCHFADNGERFTFTEEAVGPRLYMAPELEDGRVSAVAPASDVYSIGKILYFLFTGKVFAREKHRDAEWLLKDPPGDSTHALINEFLDLSVVAEAGKRIQGPYMLVYLAEKLQDRVARRCHAIGKNIRQHCNYCGVGSYKTVLPANAQPSAMHNFGFAPGDSRWIITSCDHCGNTQYFRLGNLETQVWD